MVWLEIRFDAPLAGKRPRLVVLLGVLLAAHVALLFVRPSGAFEAPAGDALDVGIVFDVGGRGDKSFNDGAYLGAERAAEELGARVRFIEPGEGSDREAGLRLLAAEGMDLVVGVGFIFTDDLTALAAEYPNTAFAGVDYSLATDANGRYTYLVQGTDLRITDLTDLTALLPAIAPS